MGIEHGDKTYFKQDEPVSGGISSGQPSDDIEEEKNPEEQEKDSEQVFDMMNAFLESHPEIISDEARVESISKIKEFKVQVENFNQIDQIEDIPKAKEMFYGIINDMSTYYEKSRTDFMKLAEDSIQFVDEVLKLRIIDDTVRVEDTIHGQVSDRFKNEISRPSWILRTMDDNIGTLNDRIEQEIPDEYFLEDMPVRVEELESFIKNISQFTYLIDLYGKMTQELLISRKDIISNNYDIAYGPDAHRKSPFYEKVNDIKMSSISEEEKIKAVEEAKSLQQDWEKDFNRLTEQGIFNWLEITN